MKKLILAVVLFSMMANTAKADCYCACINGENQAICTGPLNIAPICPPAICN